MLTVMHEPSSQTSDEYLGATDAGQYLGVSQSTLLRYEKRGLLHPHRLPGGHRRYSRVELAALMGRKAGETETAAS